MSLPLPTSDRRIVLALAVPLAVVLALAVSGPNHPVLDFEAACFEDNPYLATTCYWGLARPEADVPYEPRAAAVALLNDTPNNRVNYVLSTFAETGAVWGLAYQPEQHVIYAAAYHKRQFPFGPGGPGAVYRIGLDTRDDVTHWATVPDAGDDHHEQPITGHDGGAAPWVGRTSLGDLDVGADGEQLFVVNLNDGRIYRFSTADGALVGSFSHGAAGTAWSDEARPMALEWHDGWLYHGVTRTAARSGRRLDLKGYVYRSRPDGSDMTQVAEIPLVYERGAIRPSFYSTSEVGVDWQPWDDRALGSSAPDIYASLYPQPLLADIEIDDSGHLVVGLRDRRMDTSAHYLKLENMLPQRVKPRLRQLGFGMGVGDLLRGTPNGDGWTFDTTTEHFDDATEALGDESAHGGLAELPSSSTMAAGSYGVHNFFGYTYYAEGVYWYDSAAGEKRRLELICDPSWLRPYDPRGGQAVYAHNGEIPPMPPQTPVVGTPGTPGHPTVPPGVTPTASATPEGPRDFSFRGPNAIGDLEIVCDPDAAPTATPSVTPTQAAPTPSSPTPNVTTTPLPPQAAYLPWARKAKPCRRIEQHVDVALVLDMSTSMQRLSSAGRAKHEAALEAARDFAGLLALRPDGDQVAVVGFNHTAWRATGLTGARSVVEAALASLPARMAEGTRLDLAFTEGQTVLADTRRNPDNRSVLILLTDGLPNRVPTPIGGGSQEATVLAAAQAAKDAGTQVYTIGLGQPEDIATDMLRAAASARELFYEAPDGEDLADIYRQIAGQLIACP